MKFLKSKIKNLYIIKPEPFMDERGMFRRSFCKKELLKNKIKFNIKQTNISQNKFKYTLRGFHYQKGKDAEDKIITCIKGEIYNIVLDMRKNSLTYLKWQHFILNDRNKYSIIVPKGCANAYLTLKDDTQIFYYHSQYYSKGSEAKIRFNDPFFKFKWPKNPVVISKIDRNIKDYIY